MKKMDLYGQIWGLLFFLTVKQHVDGQSHISLSRRGAVSVNLTLICKDDGLITGDVNFLQNSVFKGACSTACGSGVSGYSVAQNRRAQETYLTISSLEDPRDCGNWICRQGAAADSSPVKIQCPLPCLLNPSDINVTPPVSNLTSVDNISVQVTVACCTKTADMNWMYQREDGTLVTLASTTSTPNGSCPAGQAQTLNAFMPQRNAFPTSGKVNLTLSIEHDSFDPPSYTVVYTKEIDLGETSTLPTPSTTSSNISDYSSTTTEGTTGPTPQPGICDNNDWCYLFFLLLLLLIPFFVLVWWCRKKKRDKKSERSDDKKDERIEFKQMNRC